MKDNLQQSRMSLRFYGLALLGLLTLASATPVRALGQQNPEPAAQPSVETPSQEAQNPPKTQAAQAEEQENDQYRHA